MSNNLETTPAAELVGKIQKLDAAYENAEMGGSSWIAERNTFSQELDRRCEAAGVRLKGSVFVFSRIRRNGDDVYIGQGHADDVGGSELHALLGWLLMKGGQGK